MVGILITLLRHLARMDTIVCVNQAVRAVFSAIDYRSHVRIFIDK